MRLNDTVYREKWSFNYRQMLSINTHHAAGAQTTARKCHKIVKNVNIIEFRSYIWNQGGKYIQISTNMPSIGSIIPETAVDILEFRKTQNYLSWLIQ